MEKLVIAGREFSSRLFLGTGKFDSNALMAKAIEASGTEMVTVDPCGAPRHTVVA